VKTLAWSDSPIAENDSEPLPRRPAHGNASGPVPRPGAL